MVYKRFMVSYLIILMIPTLISGYVYRNGLRVIERDATETRLFMLRQMRDMVDRSLREIDETRLRLLHDPMTNLMQQLDAPMSGTGDIYRFWEYNRVVSKQTLTGNSIKSRVFVFFNRSGAVFSHNTTNFGYDFVYDNVLSYQGLSRDEWMTSFFQDDYGRKYLKAENMVIDGEEASCITYLYSLPSEHAASRSGVIAFFIDNNRIKELLGEANLNGQGWVSLRDGKGDLVTGISQGEYSPVPLSIGDEEREGYYYDDSERERFIILYARSQYNDWSYAIGLPYSSIIGELRGYRRNAILIFAVTAFLGMAVSAFLAYVNGKPLHETAKMVIDSLPLGKYREEASRDEVDILCGGVKDLIEDNEDLKERLDSQIRTLKNTVIDQILKGEIHSTEKIGLLLDHLGISHRGRLYQVASLRINRYDQIMNREILSELDHVRLFIEEILERNERRVCGLTHYTSQNEIALLFLFTPENYSLPFVRDILKDLGERIGQRYNAHPYAGIGTVTGELLQISQSYGEARFALGRVNRSREHILSYDSLDVDSTAYYYPQEVESKLINLTKAGSLREVKRVLSEVYRQNFHDISEDRGMKKLLLLDMWATVMKIDDEMGFSEIPRNYPRAFSDEISESRFFNRICDAYSRLCGKIESEKKSHNRELKEAVQGYIDENFIDPMLCVALISSRFHLSESYFSQFFKEQLGETFGSYLENLRIKRACELIREGELIDNIAQGVGYKSPHSFRRAFKRVKGMSPSSFRDILERSAR